MRNLQKTTIYVPATITGGTGLIVTQSGVDITDYEGPVKFVLTATTSSTAGANDKVAVVVQHSTASAHGDASWADVTGLTFVVNSTGSIQMLGANSNELKKYVRMKAIATGTFGGVGLAIIGQKK